MRTLLLQSFILLRNLISAPRGLLLSFSFVIQVGLVGTLIVLYNSVLSLFWYYFIMFNLFYFLCRNLYFSPNIPSGDLFYYCTFYNNFRFFFFGFFPLCAIRLTVIWLYLTLNFFFQGRLCWKGSSSSIRKCKRSFQQFILRMRLGSPRSWSTLL